jgi:hypothetical protein
MSMLVTVAELQERFRVDTDIPAFSADTHVTTTNALDFVKRSASKLAGLIQEAGASEQYLTLNTTLNTVADVPVVSLPANTADVIRVALVLDGDREVQLNVAPLDDWNPDQVNWDNNFIPWYRVIGATLTLFPTPTAIRSLRVYYTVGFTVTSTADVLALRSNWDEYIVANCSVLVRNKQNKAGQEFLLERDRAEAAIVRQLKRDRAGVRQVRDVRGDWRFEMRRRGYYW